MAMDYGKTLNLLQTDFPMRGNLPQAEPKMQQRWEEMDIYRMVQESRKGKPKFILHDGPPYANGDIHIGHALNKIIKDIIVRFKTMQGYDAPYVPGWDTHGLPIEQAIANSGKVDRKKMSVPNSGTTVKRMPWNGLKSKRPSSSVFRSAGIGTTLTSRFSRSMRRSKSAFSAEW